MRDLNDLLGELWPKAIQHAVEIETLSIESALNRVLAQDVVSTLNVPAHDNSSMDGYAVRVHEVNKGVALPVSQRIPAGGAVSPLQTGTVARIFTGAMIPPGANAVVMQEDTRLDEQGHVEMQIQPFVGQFIRRAGEDIRQGQIVLTAGCRLDAIKLGLLASIGIDRVTVFRRLKVGVLVTGSELQRPGLPLGAGQIYNSNEYVWVGLLQDMGFEVHSVGIVPDDLESTCSAIDRLRACDVIVSSGGVSVGEEDHVKPAIERLGELTAWKVAMKPGKPLAVGRLPSSTTAGNHSAQAANVTCWFFGLPGNPVSSALVFLLIVRPFMQLLAGRALHAVDWREGLEEVVCDFDWPKPDPRREEFLRVSLQGGRARLFGNQSSGVLTSLDQSTGLIRVAKGQAIKAGDTMPYLSLSRLYGA